MTCGRIGDLFERFMEVVKKALEERAGAEYCIYDRDIRGYIEPRPNPELKVYACGAYAALYRSYRLLVVPGAVVVYDVDMDVARCRAVKSYDEVARLVMRRPHYTVCIYNQPTDLTRAMVCN